MDAFFTLHELRSELSALGHDDVPDDVIIAFLAQLQITVPDCFQPTGQTNGPKSRDHLIKVPDNSLFRGPETPPADHHVKSDEQDTNRRQSASFQLENGLEAFSGHDDQKSNTAKNTREKTSVSWDLTNGIKPFQESSPGGKIIPTPARSEEVRRENGRSKPKKCMEKKKESVRSTDADGGHGVKNSDHYWISVENKSSIKESHSHRSQVSTEKFLRDCSKPIFMLGENSSEENRSGDQEKHEDANRLADQNGDCIEKQDKGRDTNGNGNIKQPILKHLFHKSPATSKIPQGVFSDHSNNSRNHPAAPSGSKKSDRLLNGFRSNVKEHREDNTTTLRPPWTMSNNECNKSAAAPERPKTNSKQGTLGGSGGDDKMRKSRERSRSKDRTLIPKRRGKIDRVARYAELQKIWKSDSFLNAADGKRKKQSFHKMFSSMHIAHEQHRDYPIMIHAKPEAAGGRKHHDSTVQIASN